MKTKETKNLRKMTLKDYVESLSKIRPKSPRQKFIDEITARCNVKEMTARSWFNKMPPYEEYIRIIEEITGISREDLWK